MRNGTDRDIALQIVADMETISEKIAAINNNLYHVVILTQPTDQEAEVSTSVTFSIVAANVVSYQWQARYISQDVWNDASGASAQTDTWTFTSTALAFTRVVRCKMVGKDGEIVYSNVCTLTEIEAGG